MASRSAGRWLGILLLLALAINTAHAAKWGKWLSAAKTVGKFLVKNSDRLVPLYGQLAQHVKSFDPVKGARLLARLEANGGEGVDYAAVTDAVSSLLPALGPTDEERAHAHANDAVYSLIDETGSFPSIPIPVGDAPDAGYYPSLYNALAELMSARELPTYIRMNSSSNDVMVAQIPGLADRHFTAANGGISADIDVVRLVAIAITASIARGGWPTGITRTNAFKLQLLNGTEGRGKLLLTVSHNFVILAPLASNKTASTVSGLVFNVSNTIKQAPHIIKGVRWDRRPAVDCSLHRGVARSMLDRTDGAPARCVRDGGEGVWTTVLNARFKVAAAIPDITTAMVEGLKQALDSGEVKMGADTGGEFTFTVRSPKGAANVRQILYRLGSDVAAKKGNALLDVTVENSDWSLG